MTLAVGIVSMVVLARLIPPYEYGLAAMAMVVLVFAQTFRDMGITQAALRKGHVTESELNLIFWLTVLSTTVLSIVIIALSPAVASFFDEPIVTWLLCMAVVGFFVSGVTLQHRTLLERELRFGAIAAADIAGALIGLVVALALAFVRGDAWAIVTSTVIQAIASGLLVVVWSRWRPSRPRSDPHLWDLVRFGLNSTVYSTSILVSNHAASFIVGGSMGAAALGQYSRAQTLYAMPASNLVQPFARSTMPLLLRLRQHPDEYRLAYVRLVRRLSVFLVPLAVLIGSSAVQLTQVMLGPNWEQAGLVLRALSPSLAVMGLGFAVNDVLVTQNRAAALRNLGLLEAVVRIGAMVFGAQFGLVAAALSFTVATVLVTISRIVVASKIPPVSVADQLGAALPGALTGFGAAAGCGLILVIGFDSLGAATVLIAQCLAAFTGALLAGLVWSQSREAMWELADAIGLAPLARRLRRRR